MKNIALVFGLIAATTFTTNAGNSYKGPKAKNLKAWEKTEYAKKAVTTVEENQNGPIVKNSPVWSLETLASLEITNSERTSLSGPEAKNYKPWNTKQSNNLSVDFLVSK